MLQFCHINGGLRTSKNVNFVHKFMSTMKLLSVTLCAFMLLNNTAETMIWLKGPTNKLSIFVFNMLLAV